MPDDERPALSRLLRRIRLGRQLPEPSAEEPTDEELIRLVEGSLSDQQRHQLEERLAACPFSADRVAIVREALRDAGIVLPGKLRAI